MGPYACLNFPIERSLALVLYMYHLGSEKYCNSKCLQGGHFSRQRLHLSGQDWIFRGMLLRALEQIRGVNISKPLKYRNATTANLKEILVWNGDIIISVLTIFQIYGRIRCNIFHTVKYFIKQQHINTIIKYCTVVLVSTCYNQGSNPVLSQLSLGLVVTYHTSHNKLINIFMKYVYNSGQCKRFQHMGRDTLNSA